MPHQRKLSEPEKQKAMSLLGMKANKKLVQESLSQQSGNIILLKDLSNLSTQAKKGNTRNDLDSVAKLLIEKYGKCIVLFSDYKMMFYVDACVEVCSDNEKNFRGLLFQDKQMSEAFEAYPELLFLDATYKLLDLNLPVFMMLCEDSNGQSEVVAVCILVSEDANGIKWMLQKFKCNNANWDKIRVVMADKDLKERQVVKKMFPSASVLICLFHTLRTFRREVTCEKLGITAAQRSMCLEVVQKIVYSTSSTEYDKLYDQIKTTFPKRVKEYYDDNWHKIKDEWVLGLKADCGSFLNMTNNRLESINGKLKQVISLKSSLEEFVTNFFVILRTLRIERDHKAALMCHKVKVQLFARDTVEADYNSLLTPYSFSFINKQLQLMSKVKEIKYIDSNYVVETTDGVSDHHCECVFFKSMRLPCRHIFVVRNKLGLPLFDSDLCDKRWTSEYYKKTQRIFFSAAPTPSVSLSLIKSDKKRNLTQHEKFRKASLLTSELASVMSESSRIHFNRKVDLVKDLIDYWKAGEEVALTPVEDGIYTVQDDLLARVIFGEFACGS